MPTWDDRTQIEHRGLACAVIMQCAAALETESHEICAHGPASHLGSNDIDREVTPFLSPLADIVDDQSTMKRFSLILHVLRKQSIDAGTEPYQSAALVVRLRNEIVHYKSRWGADIESASLFRSLLAKRHRDPPFTDPRMNFFPLRCLSADCAAWALVSVVAFLEHVYRQLEVPSRFAGYRASLNP